MSKTAILVDGGFYRKRAKKLWGQHSPQETASGLITYVRRHLKEHVYHHELYRIFYYDCAPVNKQMYHPLLKRTVNLGATPDYSWMCDFLNCLKEKRKVALRLAFIVIRNHSLLACQQTVPSANKESCLGDLP